MMDRSPSFWKTFRRRFGKLVSVQTLLIVTIATYGLVCGVSLLIL